jgi:hypothetical protein
MKLLPRILAVFSLRERASVGNLNCFHQPQKCSARRSVSAKLNSTQRVCVLRNAIHFIFWDYLGRFGSKAKYTPNDSMACFMICGRGALPILWMVHGRLLPALKSKRTQPSTNRRVTSKTNQQGEKEASQPGRLRCSTRGAKHH